MYEYGMRNREGVIARHHPLWGFILAVLGAAAVLAAVAPSGATAACPNEAIRAEQGAATLALPECRAYELVSPGGSPFVGSTGLPEAGVRAADDGNAMAYFSWYPFEGSPSSGALFRSRRGVAGWSLEAMSPQVLPSASEQLNCEATELDYSEDLSASVLTIGRETKQEYPEEPFCGQPQEKVVPGEPSGFANLLRRADPSAPYELLNLTPPGTSPANAQFQAASDDLSHVAFGEEAQLTAEAQPGYNLYLWVGGTVRLVTFLPDGTPVRGDLAGATRHRVGPSTDELEGGSFSGTAPITNAISSSGERVFFYAEGNLYLRENAGQPPAARPNCRISEPGLACTVQIDAKQGGLGSPGGGIFRYASADGSRVFFTDESRLTPSSTAAPGKPDLYEYDVETNALADRTPGASGGADVLSFSGAGRDGSRLYFVAEEALTGAQENAQGEIAQAGQPNLYLLDEGALAFVATLDPTSRSDLSVWGLELTPQQAGPPEGPRVTLATRTSPDGRYFAFNSVRGLTGGATGTSQIFLYDAVSHTLSCASCLPGGAPGPSEIPAPIRVTGNESPAYLPRGLTDDGQLFFTTTQALLPADTDGVADVYEFRQGQLRLISDGSGAGPSFFFDASLGGGDVFFATTDGLLRSDTDNALSLYDARVGGGFAEPITAPRCAPANRAAAPVRARRPPAPPRRRLRPAPGTWFRPSPASGAR